MVMVFVRSFVLFVQIFNLKGLILPYYKVNRHYFLIHLGMHHTLLAEIIGEDKYNHITNLTWVQETKISNYDPPITNVTTTHTRKRIEQNWEQTCITWAIRKGFLHGVAANMRDALDRGSGTKNVIFSNGLNFIFECSNLL